MGKRKNHFNLGVPMDLFNSRFRLLIENKENLWPQIENISENLGDMALKFEGKNACSWYFFVGMILVCTSYFMGGSKVKITSEHKENVSLWIIICAIASSRKGSVHKCLRDILYKLKPLYKKWLIPGEDRKWQFSMDTGTVQAIIKKLEENFNSMIIEYEEIIQWVQTFCLEKDDGLLGKVCQIHDGVRWSYHTKTQGGIDIECTHCPALIGGQPLPVTHYMEKFESMGLTPRIIQIYPTGIPLIKNAVQRKMQKYGQRVIMMIY